MRDSNILKVKRASDQLKNDVNFIVMQAMEEPSVFGRVSSLVTGADIEDVEELPMGRSESNSTVIHNKNSRDGRFSIRNFNIHLITSLPKESSSQRVT